MTCWHAWYAKVAQALEVGTKTNITISTWMDDSKPLYRKWLVVSPKTSIYKWLFGGSRKGSNFSKKPPWRFFEVDPSHVRTWWGRYSLLCSGIHFEIASFLRLSNLKNGLNGPIVFNNRDFSLHSLTLT